MPKYRVELDVKTFVNMTLEVEAAGEEQAEAKALAKCNDVLTFMEPDVYALNKELKGAVVEGTITISTDDDGPDVNEIEELDS